MVPGLHLHMGILLWVVCGVNQVWGCSVCFAFQLLSPFRALALALYFLVPFILLLLLVLLLFSLLPFLFSRREFFFLFKRSPRNKTDGASERRSWAPKELPGNRAGSSFDLAVLALFCLFWFLFRLPLDLRLLWVYFVPFWLICACISRVPNTAKRVGCAIGCNQPLVPRVKAKSFCSSKQKRHQKDWTDWTDLGRDAHLPL